MNHSEQSWPTSVIADVRSRPGARTGACTGTATAARRTVAATPRTIVDAGANDRVSPAISVVVDALTDTVGPVMPP
jgi:hypothetical protein